MSAVLEAGRAKIVFVPAAGFSLNVNASYTAHVAGGNVDEAAVVGTAIVRVIGIPVK